MQNKKSNLNLKFTSTSKKTAAMVVAAVLIILCFITNHNLFPYGVNIAIYVALAITWAICYKTFIWTAHASLIKTGSLQLIICGLLAAVITIATNKKISPALQEDLNLLILMAVIFGVCLYRAINLETACIVSFLLFPYAILCVDLFLVTGFLSIILLLLGFFNGTLFFENEKLEEDEYFGNSGKN